MSDAMVNLRHKINHVSDLRFVICTMRYRKGWLMESLLDDLAVVSTK